MHAREHLGSQVATQQRDKSSTWVTATHVRRKLRRRSARQGKAARQKRIVDKARRRQRRGKADHGRAPRGGNRLVCVRWPWSCAVGCVCARVQHGVRAAGEGQGSALGLCTDARRGARSWRRPQCDHGAGKVRRRDDGIRAARHNVAKVSALRPGYIRDHARRRKAWPFGRV